MAYEIEELVPIVAELAQKYTGCDSTSITYEKAQMLMEGVLYCLNEYRNSSEIGLTDSRLRIEEQYRIGSKLVLEKAVLIKNIYNKLSLYFDDYNVKCLRDMIQRKIPEFLKWYDAKYCPQNTILIWDYPLLMNIHSLEGVDAVYTYICSIKMEQEFLKRFERNYVIDILNRARPNYEDMIDNVCEIILLNTVGHIVISKPLREFGFSTRDYELLGIIFESNSIHEIESMLSVALQKMVEQIYEMNRETLEYFECAVKEMAVRIDTAVKTNQLDKIFIM